MQVKGAYFPTWKSLNIASQIMVFAWPCTLITRPGSKYVAISVTCQAIHLYREIIKPKNKIILNTVIKMASLSTEQG